MGSSRIPPKSLAYSGTWTESIAMALLIYRAKSVAWTAREFSIQSCLICVPRQWTQQALGPILLSHQDREANSWPHVLLSPKSLIKTLSENEGKHRVYPTDLLRQEAKPKFLYNYIQPVAPPHSRPQSLGSSLGQKLTLTASPTCPRTSRPDTSRNPNCTECWKLFLPTWTRKVWKRRLLIQIHRHQPKESRIWQSDATKNKPKKAPTNWP